MKIYNFDTQEDVTSDIIGGKALSLVQMTRMGLNVPFGFAISSDLWKLYQQNNGLTEDIKQNILMSLNEIEKRTGQTFGDATNPLIVSARSGAKFSMPGMMETILDIGITPENLPALISKLGKQAALSSYQQFLRMFGHSVLEIDHKHFSEIELQLVGSDSEENLLQKKVELFTKVINDHHGVSLNNPHEILFLCIQAVLDSFSSQGAIEYRNMAGIPHDIGTAVIVQRMVFGNLSEKSGSAVVFSRNFETGAKELTGHYLPCSQGENVVRGYSKPFLVSDLPTDFQNQLFGYIAKIEKELKAVVDVEVTWEDINDPTRVYILQSRVAKVPPVSYFAIQEKLVEENIKTIDEVVAEIDSNTIYNAFVEKLELTDDIKLLTNGSPLNTGVGTGVAVFGVSQAKSKLKNGESVILVCDHFDPNDLELLTDSNKLKALITTEGGPSSHMGLVLNVLNIPGVMGINSVEKIVAGEQITVDSFSGNVYSGHGKIIKSQLNNFAVTVKEKWESVFGVQNSWSDFINEENKDTVYQQFHQNLALSKTYTSKKAGQTMFISSCFGDNISIPADIIPSDNIDQILESIAKAKSKNKGVWLRSAYTPDLLQAPYTSADITDADQNELAEWFKNPATSDIYSKFGNYSAWKEIQNEGQSYKLVYALVLSDEKGKLDKELASEHFVCSLRCERGRPTKIVIDIFDGSPHTRVLGQKLPSEIMSIVILANKSIPTRIGQVYFRFGKNLFSDLKASMGDSKLNKKLTNIGTSDLSEDDFIIGFNKLLENGQLTTDEISAHIDARKLGIIKYVSDTIISNWWKNYDLPTRMWALNKITGASVLEVQGRFSDNKNWMLIYGTKGEEENLIANKI